VILCPKRKLKSLEDRELMVKVGIGEIEELDVEVGEETLVFINTSTLSS